VKPSDLDFLRGASGPTHLPRLMPKQTADYRGDRQRRSIPNQGLVALDRPLYVLLELPRCQGFRSTLDRLVVSLMASMHLPLLHYVHRVCLTMRKA
jgi:hypothetical protein